MRSIGRSQAARAVSGIGARIISRVISWVARITHIARIAGVAKVSRVAGVSRVTGVAKVAGIAVAGVPWEGRAVAIGIHGSDAGAT